MRSRLALGTTVAVTAALLAGCNMPGTVATVNGERISQRELGEAMEVRTALYVDPEISPATLTNQTLNVMVLGTFLEGVADQHGLSVSDQEAIDTVNSVAAATGGQAWEAADFSETQLDFARTVLLINLVNSSPEGAAVIEESIQALGNADIEVNPRYGAVAQGGEIQPAVPEWIVGGGTDPVIG